MRGRETAVRNPFGFRVPLWVYSADGAPSGGGTVQPPAKPPTPEEIKAQIDAAVKAALDKSKADSDAAIKAREDEAEKKRLAAEGDYKTLFKRLEAERDAEKSAREAAEKRAAREEARVKVAAKLKLAPNLAADLSGDTESELEADHARHVERAKKWAEAAGLKQQKSGGAPGPVNTGPALNIVKETVEQKAEVIRKRLAGG